MKKKRGFTLVELLVVIAIIALLMSIMMPALGKAKKLAQNVVCLNNLKNWGLFWQMYLNANESYFPVGYTGNVDDSGRWWKVLLPYYEGNEKVRMCPTTTKVSSDVLGSNAGSPVGPFMAWGDFSVEGVAPKEALVSAGKGSYGCNFWIYNESPNDGGRPGDTDNYWRHAQVKGGTEIPLMAGCTWPISYHGSTGGALETDDPPDDEMRRGTSAMSCHCLNRHNGYVNGVFLDFTPRSIGLKELWTLKWHRVWERDGLSPWTKRGGVAQNDWPVWMRKYTDY